MSERTTRKGKNTSNANSQHSDGASQRVSSSRLAMRSPSIQTKLEVNAPGDAYEQEADAVADTVMRSPSPPANPTNGHSGGSIQRMEDDDAVQREEMDDQNTVQRMEDDDAVQRMEMDEQNTVQRDGEGTPSVSSRAARTINNPGAGNPLPGGVRSQIEPHIGADLSRVRVHQDNRSAQAAGDLQARAFTHRNHIFLNRTESSSDLRLMAHESTHVVQQSSAIQRQAEDETTANTRTNEPAPSPLPTPAPNTAVGSAPSSASSAAGSVTAQAPSTDVTPIEPEREAVQAPTEDSEAGTQAPTADGGGNASAEATAAGSEQAASGAGGAAVELLVPEAPAAPSPSQQQRIESVQNRAGENASAQASLPAAESNVAGARGAVTEPEEETQARAEQTTVNTLDERPEPSPEIEELIERIKRVIREKRPTDEDSLVDANPREMAAESGRQMNQSVEGDAQRVQGEYDQMQTEQQGAPATQPAPLENQPPAESAPDPNATNAAPDALSEGDVSLDADVEANRQRMEDAGMTSEPAQAVQSGPIADARDAQAGLEEQAERAPAEVLAEQDTAISNARSDMADLQARAMAALEESRSTTTSGTESQQTEMVGSEEEMRASVGRRANEIFSNAQTRVDDLMRDLPTTAMQRWEAGIARHSYTFEQALARVKRWIDERHESTALALWDAVTGMPDWVTEEYDRAEREFGDNVADLIRDISRDVNAVVASAQAIIKQANDDIAALYDSLPAEMQDWAQQQKAEFGERLEGLSQSVNETRDNFNRDLSQRASQAVQEVRQRVEQLRSEARGILGRAMDAIAAFIDDPVRAIINGLLELVGIAPASFWALVARIQQVISDIADDPMNFANNLMEALKQGFQRFFDNIGTHLFNGLINWLFGAMGSVGVTIPTDFSLKSIITFFLQLMGITWTRIRKLLAKHVGEENVALIEQAWELISTLIEKGPEGIWEMIKDQFNPQAILDMIIQTAIEYVTEALIKQVAIRIIGMLNPAGAIAQAIELIYKLLKWLFENAARIFSLIETVVNGIADIIAGNIGGMAEAVENALGQIVPIVIDFLAGLLGLGDLPDKIAEKVKSLQDWVEGMMDRAIGWLAERAKALLARLGLGGQDREDGESESDYDGQIGEIVRWTAGEERHRMWILDNGGNVDVMMASGAGQSIGFALEQYEGRVQALQENGTDEQKAAAQTAQTGIGTARTLETDVTRLAAEVARLSRAEDAGDQLSQKDAELENKQNELRVVMRDIQVTLGLDDDARSTERLQAVRAYYGNSPFSATHMRENPLSVSKETGRNLIKDWIGKGLLFKNSSATKDPKTMYSFDPLFAGYRATSPNNRSKYGYINPSKTSRTGLTILNKGLRRDLSPRPILDRDSSYHQTHARYQSTKPGSSYNNFGFGDAILGHKVAAVEHWNSIGHTWPRSKIMTWNKHPVNYQGPEHRTESSGEGGALAAAGTVYKAPSKEDGSHSSWWS